MPRASRIASSPSRSPTPRASRPCCRGRRCPRAICSGNAAASCSTAIPTSSRATTSSASTSSTWRRARGDSRCPSGGDATKIDGLLLRECLHQGRAVPAPGAGKGVAGGYTAMLLSGVASNVLHVDVTSLYPSLMLARGIAPAADSLGVFPTLLRDLREFRVAAKRASREAESSEERTQAGALQQTFKILINSFYGYLAFSQGHWNDYDAANQVTGEGRDLVQALVARLGELGAAVIEVDTDGIYFVAPDDANEESLLVELERVLPPEIQL